MQAWLSCRSWMNLRRQGGEFQYINPRGALWLSLLIRKVVSLIYSEILPQMVPPVKQPPKKMSISLTI